MHRRCWGSYLYFSILLWVLGGLQLHLITPMAVLESDSAGDATLLHHLRSSGVMYVSAVVNCDCYDGVLESVDPCVCSCTAPNLAPYCAFEAEDFAKIHFAHNISDATFFFGSLIQDKLELRYGLSRSGGEINFQMVDESSNDFHTFHHPRLVSRWLIRGSIASQILTSFQSGDTYFRDEHGIVDMDVYKPTPAVAGEASEAIRISAGEYGHLGAIWVICLLILFLIAFIENCCLFSNTTEKCEELQEDERLKKKAEQQKQQQGGGGGAAGGGGLTPSGGGVITVDISPPLPGIVIAPPSSSEQKYLAQPEEDELEQCTATATGDVEVDEDTQSPLEQECASPGASVNPDEV